MTGNLPTRKTALDLAAQEIARRLGQSAHIYRGTGFVHVATEGGTIIARGRTYALAVKAARAWCEEFDARVNYLPESS